MLDTDAEQKKVDKLIQLTERYCVVMHTISMVPEMSVRSSRVEMTGSVGR